MGVQATGFTGEKSARVKKQMRLTIKIGEISMELNFLIIPKLVETCLVGVDSLKLLGGNVDLENELVYFQVENNKKFLSYNKFKLSLKEPELVNGVNDEFSGLLFYETGRDKFWPEYEKSNIDLSDREINSKVDVIENLSSDQREKLRSFIYRYRDIFKKTPGRFESYQHKLILKNPEPHFHKSNGIPFNYRDVFSDEVDRM